MFVQYVTIKQSIYNTLFLYSRNLHVSAEQDNKCQASRFINGLQA